MDNSSQKPKSDAASPQPAAQGQGPGRQWEGKELGRKLSRSRPWVQAGFLGLGWRLWASGCTGFPAACSTVIHARSRPSPAPSGSWPIMPRSSRWPLKCLAWTLGVLLVVAAASGSLACGWACPFGFLQDLLGKATPRKITLPAWARHTRYVVLAGLVILLPLVLGSKGKRFENQTVSNAALPGRSHRGRPALLGAEPPHRSWLDDELVQVRAAPGGCGGGSGSFIVPAGAVLSPGRVAGAVQPAQPVHPLQSEGMCPVQPLPEPVPDGGQGGQEVNRLGLRPVPRVRHLRRNQPRLAAPSIRRRAKAFGRKKDTRYGAGILAAGEARARRISAWICNERATKPAAKRTSQTWYLFFFRTPKWSIS